MSDRDPSSAAEGVPGPRAREDRSAPRGGGLRWVARERPSRLARELVRAREPLDASVSLVLPAYDEVECIGEAVEQAAEALEEGFREWEVIVVDDGSSDGTARVVEAAEESDPRVRLVRHPENRGYGAAIATGFDAARHELVAYTDADLQFDVRELPDLARTLERERADAVLGFRVYRYDAVLRCMLSWVYNRLVRVVFGVRVRDVDCAFKLFRQEVVEALQLDSTDFFVDTEMVAETRRLGFRTVEHGVRHYPRLAGRTTVRPSDVPRTLLTVARMWFRLRRRPKRPRRALGPDA